MTQISALARSAGLSLCAECDDKSFVCVLLMWNMQMKAKPKTTLARAGVWRYLVVRVHGVDVYFKCFDANQTLTKA